MAVVTALRAGRGGAFELEVDGVPCCRLTGAVVAQWGLAEGQELDDDQVRRLQAAAATADALNDAHKLLERRARSRSEVESRLRTRSHDDGVVHEVLARLTAQGLIDDDDFARRYVADKRALGGWGEIRIRRGLTALGVEDGVVDAALAGESAGEDDELARALQALRRRGPARPPLEAARRRAYQALLRKGFAAAVAYRAVRAWSSDRGDFQEE
jgi:regulatory protein